jgi:hypothetical protein
MAKLLMLAVLAYFFKNIEQLSIRLENYHLSAHFMPFHFDMCEKIVKELSFLIFNVFQGGKMRFGVCQNVFSRQCLGLSMKIQPSAPEMTPTSPQR